MKGKALSLLVLGTAAFLAFIGMSVMAESEDRQTKC